MKILGFELTRARPAPAEERILTVESAGPLSATQLHSILSGVPELSGHVHPDVALTVPAVNCAVNFLSSGLANLPLHLYRASGETSERITGGLQKVLNEAPNPEWTSYGARRYFWQSVFLYGRGLMWIERAGTNVVALWPMDPCTTSVKWMGGRKTYLLSDGRTYASSEVIDVPFMLRSNQIDTRSPIQLGAKAINLALAMEKYANGFFAGGGVPPLALEGPLPQSGANLARALSDMQRSIEVARQQDRAIFPMPPGHSLKPVGIEPDKGQMKDSRLFQIGEIARVFDLPPTFLHDLTNGTMANTEQQGLSLVKYQIARWAKALEEELNLKLFGPANNKRYCEHKLDALLRGDFKTRIEGLARAVQTSIMTPDEARGLENLPPKEGGDQLFIQGATVPLATQTGARAPTAPTDPGAPPAEGMMGESDDDAGA